MDCGGKSCNQVIGPKFGQALANQAVLFASFFLLQPWQNLVGHAACSVVAEQMLKSQAQDTK